MLSALLLTGIITAPVTSAALFVPVRRRGRVAGRWPAFRRLGFALAGTVLLAAAVAGLLPVIGVERTDVVIGAAAFVLASLLWLPATRRWNARAHLCWVSNGFLFVAYLAFILHWTIVSDLGVLSTAGGVVLWLLEVVAAVMAGAYLWELCDVLGTEHWRRSCTARSRSPRSPLSPSSR